MSTSISPVTKDEFMQASIDEARLGRSEGGIPIDSVLARNGQIVSCPWAAQMHSTPSRFEWLGVLFVPGEPS